MVDLLEGEIPPGGAPPGGAPPGGRAGVLCEVDLREEGPSDDLEGGVAQCAQNAKIRKKLIIPMYLNHIASLRCHWNRLFMRNLNLGCPVLFCAIMAYFVLFLPYFGNFWAIFEPNSTSLVSKSMYLSLGIQW